LAVRVRHSRRGCDVADAAYGELVGAPGQTPVAASAFRAAAATYVSESVGRWRRSGGNFLFDLTAEAEKSGEREKEERWSVFRIVFVLAFAREREREGGGGGGQEEGAHLFFCRGCTPAAKRLRY